MAIIWAEHQKLFTIIEVFLKNCATDRHGKKNDISWLMEDPDFMKSALFLAEFVYREEDFFTALAFFVKGLLKERKYLADKVTLERIKRYRPDVYNEWVKERSEG